MPNADLSSLPKIKKLPTPDTGTVFYSHGGDAFKGLRLAVGKTKRTWVLSKRIGASVKSITVGDWPELPDGWAALKKSDEKLAAVEMGTDAKATGMKTLGDAFASHLAKSTASENTKKTYRTEIDLYLKDIFALPIEKVTLTLLENRLAEIARTGKVSTAQHVCTIIRMASKRASDVRRTFNVAAELRVNAKHQKKDYVPFLRSDLEAPEKWPALDLILGIKSHARRVAWIVMLFTGMRASSVTSLEWSRINLDRQTIRLDKMKNGAGRTFPMADVVAEALRTLPRHDRWCFPAESKSGHAVELGGFTQMVGDKEVRLLGQHDCRRLFTTAARREKLPPYIIDQLRGDTPKSVQDIYDQGSASHEDANKIAARILSECGFTSDSLLDQVRRGS